MQKTFRATVEISALNLGQKKKSFFSFQVEVEYKMTSWTFKYSQIHILCGRHSATTTQGVALHGFALILLSWK